MRKGAADPIDTQIPVTYLTAQSPGQEQVLAARVFHLNHSVIGQSPAPDHFFSKPR